MDKPIAIIAGEPNSISSEIIFKSWMQRKKFKKKSFFIIGSVDLFNMQKKRLKYKIQIKEIDNDFKKSDLTGKALPIYDVKYFQKKTFEKISDKSNKYIFKCFDTAINLLKKKKIDGIINCPVAKETLFKKKHQGITEFLSRKYKTEGNEVMLIYNKNLSVSPVTTHIPLSEVNKKINKIKIIKKVKIIDKFYKKILKKKPIIAVLGVNPHNYLSTNRNEKIGDINKAIKILKENNIKVVGPISPDSSFMSLNKSKFDVIVGMYHDQVLAPFKALYNFHAINITLGLPFLRVSPDHGVASNIVGKKMANPQSLIESIQFFNKVK